MVSSGRIIRMTIALFFTMFGFMQISIDHWSNGILLFIIAYYIGVPNYGFSHSKGRGNHSFSGWMRSEYESRENVIPKAVKQRNWRVYSTNNNYQVDSVTLHDIVFDFTDTLNSADQGLLVISDYPEDIDVNDINYQDYKKINITIVESYPSQYFTYHNRFKDLFTNAEISILFVPSNQSKERTIHDSFCMYGSACPYE